MDFRKIFIPPEYDTIRQSQKAAFLHFTLIIAAVALLLFGVLNLTWNAPTLGWFLLGVSGSCIVSAVLNKNKRYKLAAILFSILIIIAIFYNLVDGAALHDPGIAALPIFLILVSILFNRGYIPYFTLATILGIFAIYYFWKTDLLVLSQAPTLNRVMVLTILQGITGIFSWMIVSTQRETSEKLEWSEKRFQSLFMAAPIGIGVTSLGGRVLAYNESLVKMGGYTPDEFRLLNVQDYYKNPEDRVTMLDILKSAGVVRGYETVLMRKDKSVFDVNMSVIPLNYGADEGLLTIIEDISERKQIELERQEELEFRRLLVDSSPIFFTVVDRQGKTTMMNKSMLDALDYQWEEIREVEYINTFVPEREQSAVLMAIEDIFKTGKTSQSENKILTKTGQELLIEWYACPIKSPEDNIDYIFAYGVDITDRKKAEKAFKESAERDRVFFEESPLLNWHFDLIPPMPLDLPIEDQIEWILHKSTLVDVNASAVMQTGRGELDVVMGTSLYINWGEKEDYGSVTLREFIKSGYNLKMYETPEYTTKGEVSWSIINGFGTIEDNHLVRILGTTMDITNRKQAEDKLRESDTRNRLLLGSLPMAFYRAHPSNQYGGTWVSDQIDQIVGFFPEEMVDPDFWSSRLHPEDREMVLQAFDTLGDTDSLETEYRWQNSDGKYIWIQDNAVLVKDEKGNPKEIVGTWIDISERKEIEQSIMESEERYRTLFENAAEGISIHAGEKYIDINNTWLEMFGYQKEEVLNRTPFDFSPEDQPDGTNSIEKGTAYLNKARDGNDQLFEWRHVRSDGSEFDTEIFMTIFDLSGQEVMISFVRDLTERKRAEVATQEERQRIARELHDAVSQTLFSASIIAQTVERSLDHDPGAVRTQLKELQTLTLGALAEMRNLLFELRPAALEFTLMTELLQQLVDGFSGRSKADITLSIVGEDSLPFDVRLVYFRIAQEILNNIVKHARAKNVVVMYDSQSDEVRLQITDDGQGFLSSEVDAGQHGINIMKERAESIKADLQFDSQPGKGTKVKVVYKR